MPTQPNEPGDSAPTRGDMAQRGVSRPVPAAESTPRSFRTATMQRCPNCGERNNSHASICATCGENLRVKPQKIRCRHCNYRASSVLTICPQCGRELQAAPARWLYWAAPTLLVLLFLGVLIGQGGVLRPLQWAQTQVRSAISWVQQLGERMDPQFTLEPPPSEDPSTPTPVAQVADSNPPAAPPAGENAAPSDNGTVIQVSLAVTATQVVSAPATLPPTATDTPPPEPTATTPPTATEAPTATASPSATASPAATATATQAATATATNTLAPTKAPTASPTATLTATRLKAILLPTPTTALSITAELEPLTTKTAGSSTVLASTAKATATATATRTPLLLPTNTPVPTPTQTATDTPAPTPTSVLLPTPNLIQRTYTIQDGDTLSEIADSFNISVEALMAANKLTQEDIYALRPGDVLEVPGAGEPVTSAPANNAVLAPAAEVSNAVSAQQANLRLNAPQLRSPENNTQISCNGNDQLVWLPVDFILADDLYILHLGFVNGVAADGKDKIVWVLEQAQAANNTLWNPDPGLCGLAPQEFGRKWYWYVEVVEGKTGTRAPVSPPSQLWSFRWN